MKLVAARMIAILMLVIPGLAATYGFLAMKDAIFVSFDPHVSFPWLHFLLGVLLFAAGTGFIGGWIFYRDRKHNYVAPRFREKKQRRRPRPGSSTQ